MASTFKVKVGLEHIIGALKSTGKNYVTVKELSILLGVSTKTAGRLMAKLEREGYIRRYSNKAYKIDNNTKTITLTEEGIQIRL